MGSPHESDAARERVGGSDDVRAHASESDAVRGARVGSDSRPTDASDAVPSRPAAAGSELDRQLVLEMEAWEAAGLRRSLGPEPSGGPRPVDFVSNWPGHERKT